MSRLRVYISGPISKGDLQQNIDQATNAAHRLIQAGFAPFTPQLSCYLSGKKPERNCGYGALTWMEVDLPWVQMADAVLRLPGESDGADTEVTFAVASGIPVYYDIDKLIASPPAKGSEAFLDLLVDMRTLHCRKAADYGDDEDPLANIRASEEIGIEPWRGAWNRAKDKVKRIDKFCRTGKLSNEGVEDSFLDLAAYCLIALVLFQEQEFGSCNGRRNPFSGRSDGLEVHDNVQSAELCASGAGS